MNPRLVSPRPLVNRAEAEGISSRGGEDSSNPFPQPDEKILKKREVGVRSSSVKSTRTYPLLSALPPLSFCFRLPLRFATGSLSSSSQCSPLSRILGFTLKLWFFCVRSRFGCLIVRWLFERAFLLISFRAVSFLLLFRPVEYQDGELVNWWWKIWILLSRTSFLLLLFFFFIN